MIHCISTLSSYKDYPHRHKKLKSEFYVSKVQYRKVIKAINQKAFELMLTTGEPYQEFKVFGVKQIMKIKPEEDPKDKHLSKLLDKDIRHKNFHTNKYIAKCYWFKKFVHFPLSAFWTFNFNRMMKRPNHSKKRALNMKDYITKHGVNHLLEYHPKRRK